MDKHDKRKNDNKKQRSRFETEFADDATLYGENVSSLFRWIPIKEQRARTEHLENATRDE